MLELNLNIQLLRTYYNRWTILLYIHAINILILTISENFKYRAQKFWTTLIIIYLVVFSTFHGNRKTHIHKDVISYPKHTQLFQSSSVSLLVVWFNQPISQWPWRSGLITWKWPYVHSVEIEDLQYCAFRNLTWRTILIHERTVSPVRSKTHPLETLHYLQ